MKKISTLILAALAFCGTTSVQAQSIGSGFTTGYYKMKSTTTDRTRIYVYNDEFNTVNSQHRTLVSATDAETNNYIWKITNTGNGKVSIVNGQGTPLKPENGATGSKTYGSHSELTLDDSHSTYTTSVYFTEGIHNPGNSDPNHYYGTSDDDKIYAIAYWSGTQGLNSGTCNWAFTAVSAEDDFYTVSIIGANGYVTRTSTNEGAYNGGFFKCSTTPTTENFTASSVDDYNSNITIDETNKTINVVYTLKFDVFQEQLSAAREALAKTGVGYPTDDAASRSALKAAIESGETKTEETYTYTDFPTLQTALTTYKSDASHIMMPQDGDTYVFTNVHPAGTNRYLDYSSDNLVTVERGTTPVDELPASAKFTCHKLTNTTFMFVNNEGKYLIWKGSSNGENSRKGYLDAYSADWCPMTITAHNAAFGCLNFGGKRSTSANSYFVIKNDGTFDQANLSTNYYTTTYSSAFQFEKVSYPNTVKFNEATGIDDVEYISTFSAPFATIKPTGVKAYVVKNNNGTSASLEEVEGNIPANQGVLLTSTTADAVTMVPVAGEGTATIENNLLGNTAGAAKTVAEGENIYVLSLAANASAVAFNKAKVATTLKMNKAYLTAQAGSAIALNFATGEVTGINTITTEDKADNAPIFDLTGRRVTKMVKGGLYIKAGKKVIAQ